MSWEQGYAPPNSDRREGVLRRKRLDYLDCVAQYYDISDIERTDEEINMLRQVLWMLFFFITWGEGERVRGSYATDVVWTLHL